jgi:hypothetical protein
MALLRSSRILSKRLFYKHFHPCGIIQLANLAETKIRLLTRTVQAGRRLTFRTQVFVDDLNDSGKHQSLHRPDSGQKRFNTKRLVEERDRALVQGTLAHFFGGLAGNEDNRHALAVIL